MASENFDLRETLCEILLNQTQIFAELAKIREEQVAIGDWLKSTRSRDEEAQAQTTEAQYRNQLKFVERKVALMERQLVEGRVLPSRRDDHTQKLNEAIDQRARLRQHLGIQ